MCGSLPMLSISDVLVSSIPKMPSIPAMRLRPCRKARLIRLRITVAMLKAWLMRSTMRKPKYFSDEEFRKATPSCSLSDMDSDFMFLLDKARERAGIPFVINSAFRSVEYEKSKGRSGTSQHTNGVAVDIRCYGSADRFLIVSALLDVGFTRIGISKTFIHVDAGRPFPNQSPVIWLY